MTKFYMTLLSCSLIFGAAQPLYADTFNTAKFLGIDANADNAISLEEAQQYRLRYFRLVDQDTSESIEFEEYVKANKLRDATENPDSPVPIPKDYDLVDTDHDTVLSREEFLEAVNRAFSLLDKDHDGLISKSEFISPGL